MKHIILLKTLKDKLLIQQLLNIQTQVVIYYRIGLQNAIIKLKLVNYKILLNQQKQTAQLVIRERRFYLQ